MPRTERVAWKILKALEQKNMTIQTLADQFNIPLSTVRAELTYLKKQDLVDRIPIREVRCEFKLTDAGKQRLDELKQEAA